MKTKKEIADQIFEKQELQKRAVKNYRVQKRKEDRGIAVGVRSGFWDRVSIDYGKEIEALTVELLTIIPKVRPKTVDGMIKVIESHVNAYKVSIRKIWRCNAGWGINYYIKEMLLSREIVLDRKPIQETVVYSYYDSIEACIRAEYRRVVEQKKEKGGEAIWLPKKEEVSKRRHKFLTSKRRIKRKQYYHGDENRPRLYPDII